jgi:beta-fructofuranosidase
MLLGLSLAALLFSPKWSQNTMHPSRQHLAHDWHRPQYHYLPPANWLNDPNGLIQWHGLYHLFYQHNPHGAYHARIHWGHAVSRDLVHWQDWPIALTPSPGEHDEAGCWSGCAVNNHGVPTLLYTGVEPQVVCAATSSDELRTWQKHPANPLLTGPPAEIDAGGDFRDPYVWRDAGAWTMLMGTRHAGKGLILLYSSEDLVHWEYLHPLLSGHQPQLASLWTGSIWECPNLVSLADQHVVIISFQDHEQQHLLHSGYFVGRYQNRQFSPGQFGLVDYGDCFYAPQVMVDEQGRRLMWGWLRESRPAAAQVAAGWSGVMSLPRLLSLRADGRLGMEPAPELTVLRSSAFELRNVSLSQASSRLLEHLRGDCLEILAEFELGQVSGAAGAFGLKVCCSPDDAEQTWIGYNPSLGQLEIRRDQASLNPETDGSPVVVPFELAPGQTLSLRIFLDGSVIELFANGWACLATRIYPTRPDSLGLRLYGESPKVFLKSLTVWPMRSIR